MMISNYGKEVCFYVIVLITVTTSCIDDVDGTMLNSNPLVVESYLHVDRQFKVAVSNLVGVDAADLNRLSVSVTSSEGTFVLSSVGDGVYASDFNIVVSDQVSEYGLSIMAGSGEITSLTVVPEKPRDFELTKTEITVEPIDFGSGFPSGGFSMETVDLTWSNPDKDYYFTFFENIEDNPEPINTVQATTGGGAPGRFFRSEPTRESSSTISSRQFSYYGRYNVILFHVNADYAALYQQQESSSSLSLTSPFTNIMNGMGIFTAIHSDTILFTIKKP